MPTSVSWREGWPENAPASRASDTRTDGTSTWATDSPATGSPSVTTTVAPRRTASGMKRRPSCLNPGTATKQPPGSTRRESPATDETDRGRSPITRFSGSAASNSLMVVPCPAISPLTSIITRCLGAGSLAMAVDAPRLARRPSPGRRRQRQAGDGARLDGLSRRRHLPDDTTLPRKPDLDPEGLERSERLAQRLAGEIWHALRAIGVYQLGRRAHQPHAGGDCLGAHHDLQGLKVPRRHLEVAEDLAADRVEDRRGGFAAPFLVLRLVEHDEHGEAGIVARREAHE